jgi:uncharacterized protein YndB with AHSA1/START domain
MYTFKHQYNLEANREKVWEALLDEKSFETWNGENAQIDDSPGAKLTMSFNGVRVVAKNEKVDRSRFYLHQSWQFLDKEWNFTCSVDIRLYEHSNERSMMEVEMKEIPDERKDEVEELWRVGIVEKMNHYFEQNS